MILQYFIGYNYIQLQKVIINSDNYCSKTKCKCNAPSLKTIINDDCIQNDSRCKKGW